MYYLFYAAYAARQLSTSALKLGLSNKMKQKLHHGAALYKKEAYTTSASLFNFQRNILNLLVTKY